MPPRPIVLALLLSLWIIVTEKSACQQRGLRVVTVNVWSGLDYHGVLSVGAFESRERREKRRQLLLEGLRDLNPDIVFLQEVNPVVGFSRALAGDLGMEQIHQVCNAGVKVFSVGFPANLTEGVAILARPALDLGEVNASKLSGSVGIYGDALTVHFDETIVALVGRVVVGGRPLHLVNVHLSSVPPADALLEREFRALGAERGMEPPAVDSAIKQWHRSLNRRAGELAALAGVLESLPPEVPLIVGGDFNAEVEDEHVARFLSLTGLWSVVTPCEGEMPPTWDPLHNENIRYSTRWTDAEGDSVGPFGTLMTLADARPGSIDHLFLSRHWSRDAVGDARVVLDEAREGIHPSDHFGMLADVDATSALAGAPAEWSSVADVSGTTLEPFPILSYDTDTGLGFGAKLFALNFLEARESFDLVLFGSTGGERWGRLVFSVPDFELRQGKLYPLALDLAVDFDKWVSYSFFGVGNRSQFEDREFYTRTPLEISLTASRGFSRDLVGQAGVRYLTVQNSEFEPGSALQVLPPAQNAGRATVTSAFITARGDTRDSYINPSHGIVAQCDLEFALQTGLSNATYTRFGGWIQGYFRPLLTRLVLAGRIGVQGLAGKEIPVQMLLPIGGNRTVRGSVQDRYLDRVSAVANLEVRFPVFWRFGGILGVDAGKVWHSLSEFDLPGWATNPVVGLRFSMDTYIVRLDVGFGKETTGLYLNFGHIF